MVRQQSRTTYHARRFEYAAEPTRPIEGVVRDKDTGKPIAGVTIQSDKFAGTNTSGDGSVRTVTDQDGRYRLMGMPDGNVPALEQNKLDVLPTRSIYHFTVPHPGGRLCAAQRQSSVKRAADGR